MNIRSIGWTSWWTLSNCIDNCLKDLKEAHFWQKIDSEIFNTSYSTWNWWWRTFNKRNVRFSFIISSFFRNFFDNFSKKSKMNNNKVCKEFISWIVVGFFYLRQNITVPAPKLTLQRSINLRNTKSIAKTTFMIFFSWNVRCSTNLSFSN